MKTVLFKIWKFPQLSETFIVNQIVIAIKLGFKVKILVGDLNDFEGNCNLELFKEYALDKKIIHENYRIPLKRWQRFKKAFTFLLNNIPSWNYLFKFWKISSTKGLSPIFEFCFLKQFRDVHIVHIQFGTNKHPWDILKEIGFIKSKLIVSFHGHDIHFPIGGKIVNNGYYNRLFNVANHLVCNTNFLKEKLINLGAPITKIQVIPVAVDSELFKPSIKPKYKNKIKLITVGRLDELKGQSFGISAVKSLINKGYDLEYFIVGAGTNYNKLKEEISNYKLNDVIYLLGSLTPENVVPVLQDSDIFLMTSITNQSGMAESQGLVTAEAQACGLPIVAFDSGGIKYTIQENVTGYLCNEKDINCYVYKIEYLINHKVVREEMAKNARNYILNEYSEDVVLINWKQLYS